jgi:hypothetical protein
MHHNYRFAALKYYRNEYHFYTVDWDELGSGKIDELEGLNMIS